MFLYLLCNDYSHSLCVISVIKVQTYDEIVLGAGQQFSTRSDSIVQNSSEYSYVTPNDCINKRPPPPVAADYNIYNVLYQ